jgi:predicted glycosyltransferase
MYSDTMSLPVSFNGLDTSSTSRDNVIDARDRMVSSRIHKPGESRRLRVVLYSHDTMGLGHIRRNLRLARGLSQSGLPIEVLLITGARESGGFSLPENVDVVVLPALHKSADGTYRARNLGLGIDELTALRSQIVCSTIQSFQPDLVIFDNVARGVNGELDQALGYIRDHGGIRCVLGLRDILDEPENVARDWHRQCSLEAIRHFYHAIWVYGDARVYDPRTEYKLPADVADMIEFTGYLDRWAPPPGNGADDSSSEGINKPFGLCLVGGGQDGAALALAFACASHPHGRDAVIITGPHIDPVSMAQLQALASEHAHLRILEFVPEPTKLLQDAEFVVCMGGYNTVCEVISFDKPALLVPRVVPRREQLIRAKRLNNLGIVDLLHPRDLSAEALSKWIADLPQLRLTSARKLIDMNGMQRVAQYCVDQVMRFEHPLQRRQRWAES